MSPRFRFPWRPDRAIRQDVDDELAFHLEQRAAEYRRAGLSDDQARRLAREAFGDLDDTRRYCVAQDLAAERRLRASDRLRDLGQDLRVAARRLRRQPWLLATAVGTLAVGTGATTAFWSVVRQVVLNPFPFADGSRAVAVYHAVVRSDVRLTPGLGAVELWRSHARSFRAVEAIQSATLTLLGDDGAELVNARRISETLLPTMGFSPELGRGFTAEDRAPGATRVAILGHGFWQRRFGRDPGITGRRLVLDSTDYTIIGVMPRAVERIPGAFRGRSTDVFLPLPDRPRPGTTGFTLAWLRPRTTLEQARSEMAVLDPRLATLDSAFARYATRLYTGREMLGAQNVRTLVILLGAVGLLLVIACANVAHLLLSRVLARLPEHAMRAALGARRGQLVRQGLLEALLVGGAGGGLGMLLAVPLLKGLVAARPPALEALSGVRLDPAAVTVSLALGIGMALAAGLVPAWRSAGTAPAALLHGLWATEHRGARRLRETLLVAEVALSLLLLVGAGLVARSLWKLGGIPLGYRPEGLVAATVTLPGWRYRSPEAGEAVLDRLVELVRTLPGVEGATRASGVPPQIGIMFGELEIAGRTLPEADQESFFAFQSVRPDYFAVSGTPLIEGRGFDPRGASGEAGVVVVSRDLARRYWPDRSPLGAQIRVGHEGPWRTIVGVAENVPALGLGEMRGALHLYVPHLGGGEESVLVVRTGHPPEQFEALLRDVMARLDPAVPVRRVASVERLLAETTSTERFSSWLLGGFAAFATLLFAGGLFGVLSQTVALRRREVGIRVALGAAPGRVRWLIVSQGLRPALLGLALGLAGAWFGARLVASLLHEISPRDGLTFGMAAGLTLAVTLGASYLPARRASRDDPVAALRSD